MALPPRVFFTLYEASVRLDCSIADIAGWATLGKLKIKTGIGLVWCGDTAVAGPVTLPPMDLLPLFRRSGPCPTEWVMQRIMPPDTADWLIITEPADGVSVAVADMLIEAEDFFDFEENNDLVRKVTHGKGSGRDYDWDGMNLALIKRIHDHGLPATSTELIAEMQEWFLDQTGGAKMPSVRSVGRRVLPVWRMLKGEEA